VYLFAHQIQFFVRFFYFLVIFAWAFQVSSIENKNNTNDFVAHFCILSNSKEIYIFQCDIVQLEKPKTETNE